MTLVTDDREDAVSETTAATIRYMVALAGAIIVTQGWMTEVEWTHISAGVVTVVTMLYGLYRTYIR